MDGAIYLNDVPVDQASAEFHAALAEAGALEPTAAEMTPLDRTHGRVTAEPVWAKVVLAALRRGCMDGIAIRSRETVGATETSPLRLEVDEQARWVDTGDPMPEGYDAVIMVEHVHETEGRTIEIDAPAAPYQHVRPLGEDIVATELVLPQGHRLRPQDLAACAAAGAHGSRRARNAERRRDTHGHRAGSSRRTTFGRGTSSSSTRSCWRRW